RRQCSPPELLGARDAVAHRAQHDLGRVRERADDLRALQQRLPGKRRVERLEVSGSVALLPQDLVRLPDHAFSFSRSRSLTTFGLALPFVSFIPWPTKKPSRPSLPPLKASTWPGLAASTASITGSSSGVSETAVCARYSSAVKPEPALAATAAVSASRVRSFDALTTFASSAK